VQSYNALKYITALPVMFLSSILSIRDQGTGSERVWFGEDQLFRLWLLCAILNSLYSFWWDVTNDWGLSIFRTPNYPAASSVTQAGSSSMHSNTLGKQYLRGLRQILLLSHSPLPYYIAIFTNFILRLTWSIKLSPHLHQAAEREYGVFVLEILEILRRWIWVYFRIEWEIVKSMDTGDQSQQEDAPPASPLEIQRLPL